MKMKTQQHTLLPWSLTDSIHDSKNGYTWTVAIFADKADSGDKIAAEAMASGRETARANAAHIVKCVNMHQEMVSILKRAVESAGFTGIGGSWPGDVKKILAKAEAI